MTRVPYRGVFSGGGTRGAVMLGAVAFLREQGWYLIEGLGVSAGAIVVSGLSSGKTPKDLVEIHKKLLPKDLLDPRIWPPWPLGSGKQGLFKGKKMLKAFRKHLPKNHAVTRFPVHIGVHNWTDRCNEVMTAGDLPLHVRASMSLPIFDMVEIGCRLYEDGGISANFPIDYEGWTVPVRAPTIGFSFDGPTNPRYDPQHKAERLVGSLNDMMLANAVERVEDVSANPDVSFIRLKTEYDAFDFGIDEGDIEKQFTEGYVAAQKWWWEMAQP